MTQRIIRTLAVIICLLAARPLRPAPDDPSWAQPDQTLSGIEGVRVSVLISKNSKLPELGISEDWLRQTVELRLRRNQINILTKEDWLKAPGYPEVMVAVEGGEHNELKGLYMEQVRTVLRQRVMLERNPAVKIVVPTWEVSQFGISGDTKLKESVRDTLEDQLDRFANAYLAENHKK